MEYPGQAGHHDAGHYPDPVAYGEETGYVHPESYQDHAEHPGADGPADHEGYAGPGDQDHPGHTEEPGQGYPAGEDTAAIPAATQPTAPAEPAARPQPATENSAETTGQTAPAETQDAPAADDGDAAAKTPSPDANPWLERLRSTPAPPQE